MAITKGANRLFQRIAEKGPKAVKPHGSNKTINQEIRHQKQLGTFLPDEAYSGNKVRGSKYDVRNDIGVQKDILKQRSQGTFLPDSVYSGELLRPSTSRTLDGKGSFMKDAHWDRLKQRQQKNPSDVKKTINNQKQQYKEKIETKSIPREKAKLEASRMRALMNAEPQDNALKSIGATGKTLYGSFRTAMKDEGAWKKAGIGTLQSSAVSGAGHAGLAYLQGDDPWEAAKTGMIRGAIAGAGYQGMKAATHSNTGSIWGNMKSIGTTTKETYKVNTMKGFGAAVEKGDISNQLKNVLMAKEMHHRNNQFFGLKGGV